jgi:hypothetical protein
MAADWNPQMINLGQEPSSSWLWSATVTSGKCMSEDDTERSFRLPVFADDLISVYEDTRGPSSIIYES